MLKDKDIKALETDPRQLTFGFEEEARAEVDCIVISCIKEQLRTHGQAFLSPLLFHITETHNLAEPDILQSVFWSAGDLKIHFRNGGRPITPYQAQKPFYPGRQTIKDHLQFLETLLARQDSYSLICKCYEKREGITEMAGDIDILSRFYTEQASFWELLIQSMVTFHETLSDLKQTPEAASGLARLNQILSSPSPWNLILEAEQLLRSVQNYNNRILEEKIQTRQRDVISYIDALIKKLNRMPARLNYEHDMRSRYLYLLRNATKQLQTKTTIEEINRLVNNAEAIAEEALNLY